MKRENPRWGYLRIVGELQKLQIILSRETIARIIRRARKKGDIPPNGSWKSFLRAHWDSLFCCDFLTVETLFAKRLYVFFLMEVKTRRILRFGVTDQPNRSFVRNQLTAFLFDREGEETHLIHDNSGELKWMDYASLGIEDIPTVPYSPNMNAHAERFVRSIRRECLDHFVVFHTRHLRNLVREYVNFYNNLRPHQGRGNEPPAGPVCFPEGRIAKQPVLFGLHHHYYRKTG